jgi:hypothetical protein
MFIQARPKCNEDVIAAAVVRDTRDDFPRAGWDITTAQQTRAAAPVLDSYAEVDPHLRLAAWSQGRLSVALLPPLAGALEISCPCAHLRATGERLVDLIGGGVLCDSPSDLNHSQIEVCLAGPAIDQWAMISVAISAVAAHNLITDQANECPRGFQSTGVRLALETGAVLRHLKSIDIEEP